MRRTQPWDSAAVVAGRHVGHCQAQCKVTREEQARYGHCHCHCRYLVHCLAALPAVP